MHRDLRGHFHMLVHRFAGANGSTVGTSVGGHAFSVDGLNWQYEPDAPPVYTTNLTWANGSSATAYRRERPKPVADVAGRVVALFNGVWPCHRGVEGDDSQDGALGCESFTVETRVVLS